MENSYHSTMKQITDNSFLLPRASWLLTIDSVRQFSLNSANLLLKTRGLTAREAENMKIGESVNVKIRAANYGCQTSTTENTFKLTRTN